MSAESDENLHMTEQDYLYHNFLNGKHEQKFVAFLLVEDGLILVSFITYLKPSIFLINLANKSFLK